MLQFNKYVGVVRTVSLCNCTQYNLYLAFLSCQISLKSARIIFETFHMSEIYNLIFNFVTMKWYALTAYCLTPGFNYLLFEE